MSTGQTIVLTGVTRVAGQVEGEALVTSAKLSHLANAIDSQGVVRMDGHPLQGQSYAGKIIVYDTDIFSTGGAWGLIFKVLTTKAGPLALICRRVHPISAGGAVDARIPAVDGLDHDPCQVIRTGDRVRIIAPEPGAEAVVEVFPAVAREGWGGGAGRCRAPAMGVTGKVGKGSPPARTARGGDVAW